MSEHGLYENQLHKLNDLVPGYTSFAVASSHRKQINFDQGKNIGGCGILWDYRSLAYKIRHLKDISSDRICVIELITDTIVFFIISLYLPHQSCMISD